MVHSWEVAILLNIQIKYLGQDYQGMCQNLKYRVAQRNLYVFQVTVRSQQRAPKTMAIAKQRGDDSPLPQNLKSPDHRIHFAERKPNHWDSGQLGT